jgi:hypothetical protein
MRRLIFLVVYLATLLAVATPASVMDPQFFDDLNLKNDRHTVAAGGPCHWEAGDAWAEIKNVTIEQGGVVASSGHRLHHRPPGPRPCLVAGCQRHQPVHPRAGRGLRRGGGAPNRRHHLRVSVVRRRPTPLAVRDRAALTVVPGPRRLRRAEHAAACRIQGAAPRRLPTPQRLPNPTEPPGVHEPP